MGRVRWSGVRVWRLVCAVAVCVALVFSVGPALAELQAAGASADESSFWKDVGVGAGAGLTNVLYIPAKLVYASVGGIVGGLAYVVTLGSTETANGIWEPTLGGTYVLTPGMLTGEDQLHFNGHPPMPPVQEPTFKEADSEWAQ
ncbi:MAG: hypothetical protein P8R42_22430 [Candidatus Binatia bacterium]|nr:hypothetical protein [Candidatus Binatia bacterium]